MRIVYVCNTDGAMYVFRRPLMEYLLSQNHEVIAICPDSGYFPALRHLGVIPIAMPINRHSTGLHTNILLCLRLRRMFRELSPAIIHNFTHMPAIFGTLAAASIGHKEIFVTVTGLGTTFIRNDFSARVVRLILIFLYRFALRFSRAVFFQNPDDLLLFTAGGLLSPKRAILTPGSAIDLKSFSPPSVEDRGEVRKLLFDKLGKADEQQVVFLLPARTVIEKGVIEFYKAAAAYQQSRRDAVFIHIGHMDPPPIGIDIDVMKALATISNVHFLGHFANPIDFFVASDVVVLPSYREGMPRTLLEALALDRFIITTDTPGCRETVQNNVNGILCEAMNVESLTAAMLKATRAKISEAAGKSRQLAEKNFGKELLIEITMKAYGLSENNAN